MNHSTKTPLTQRQRITRTILATGGAVLAILIVAAIIGGADSGKATEAGQAAPRTTVTVTPPPATVTKTAPAKPEVPASCLKALDLADNGFALAADGFTAVSEAMTAFSEFDIEGIDKANAKLTKLNPKVGAALAKYRTARDACQAAAK